MPAMSAKEGFYMVEQLPSYVATRYLRHTVMPSFYDGSVETREIMKRIKTAKDTDRVVIMDITNMVLRLMEINEVPQKNVDAVFEIVRDILAYICCNDPDTIYIIFIWYNPFRGIKKECISDNLSTLSRMFNVDIVYVGNYLLDMCINYALIQEIASPIMSRYPGYRVGIYDLNEDFLSFNENYYNYRCDVSIRVFAQNIKQVSGFEDRQISVSYNPAIRANVQFRKSHEIYCPSNEQVSGK